MAAFSPRRRSAPSPACGEGWVGGSLRDGSRNGFENAATIGHDIQVGEAENFEALRFDRGRATRIGPFALIREVLAAVELDDELGCMADEIGDVALDRHLAAEARAIQPVAAQLRPEGSLCIG
ncbi:hypothetical protein BJ6T_06750 [Bradyrhizobium japonicum USDA 6]|nr:hypothetical protein BJ6T_06750 [Bradyrhizobium japonicum USDA 6]